MMKQDRPSTTGHVVGGPNPNRLLDTFSVQRREMLAMGSSTGAPTGKIKRTNARITVVVRKRPLSQAEAARNENDILAFKKGSKTTLRVQESRKNINGGLYTETHKFTFDRAYAENDTNKDVYKSCVRQLVDAVFRQGARCSCFTYGQTGSGKTYTMTGPGKMGIQGTQVPAGQQGILELAAKDFFKWLQQPEFDYYFGLYVGFFEIYCNKVYDLLNERNLVKALESKTSDGVVVKDLTQVKVTSIEPLLKVVGTGLDLRIVGTNSKNNDSSRGHAVLTLEVRNEHSKKTFGKLAFIDLAGSERGADAMNSGKQTQTDGAGINRSLLALKECIRALDLQSTHVPFRDSELTKVLRDMFIEENARTLMISCVSPSSGCCEQTLNTLRYAARVKAIRRNCQPDVNSNESTAESSDNGPRNDRASRRRTAHAAKPADDERSEAATDHGAKHLRSRKGQRADEYGSEATDRKRKPRRAEISSSGGTISNSDDEARNSDHDSTLSLGTSHDSEEGMPTTDKRARKVEKYDQNKTLQLVESDVSFYNSPRACFSAGSMASNRVGSSAYAAKQQPPPIAVTRPGSNLSPTSRGSLHGGGLSTIKLGTSCYEFSTGELASPTNLLDLGASIGLRGSLGVQSATMKGSNTCTSTDGKSIGGFQVADRTAPQRAGPAVTTNALVVTNRGVNADWQVPGSSVSAMGIRASPATLTPSSFPNGVFDCSSTFSVPNNSALLQSNCLMKEQGGGDIAKIFPKPEQDDIVAAANLLRKRYRQIDFPIHPATSGDGRYLDSSVAKEMLDEMLKLPSDKIHTFSSTYASKIRLTYAELIKSHMDCLKAQTCAGMSQQKMLHDIESLRRQGNYDVSRHYLSFLRTNIENQLFLQLKLGKRLSEMERMLGLQRVLNKGLASPSTAAAEHYPLATLPSAESMGSPASIKSTRSNRRVFTPSEQVLGARLMRDSNNVESHVMMSRNMTTAINSGATSLRTIEENVPMLSASRGQVTLNDNACVSPGMRPISPPVTLESRPLQPPTASSLDRNNRMSVSRHEKQVESDCKIILSEITTSRSGTANPSATSLREARRTRKVSSTEGKEENLIVKELMPTSTMSTRSSKRPLAQGRT